MKTQITRLIVAVVMCLAVAGFAAGCSSTGKKGTKKEQDISADQMSAIARATMQKQARSGLIEKITKEVERGRTVYDVEANVDGRHMEYLIADDTGELLGTEVPIDYSKVPQPVRTAAEKYFGTSTGLTAMKGVEYGETHYEIEGMKNGKKAEKSWDASGNPEK